MKARLIVAAVLAAVLAPVLAALLPVSAYAADHGTIQAVDQQQIGKIVPGQSTKADVEALLGAPWRVVQFNDCGMAMPGQADETWEYRDAEPIGTYRLHIEFGDDGVVHLLAKIPDASPGGQATIAKTAPGVSAKGMSM